MTWYLNILKFFSITLSLLAMNFEDRWWPMQTIWIQMKPTKCGASFEIQIVWHSDYISAKYLGGNNDCLHLLKERNVWKNYPACKELNMPFHPEHRVEYSLCLVLSIWLQQFFLMHWTKMINPFSAGTAFMLMQIGWIQASRRVTQRLAWDPTCLLLSLSFPIKNKQNLIVLKSRRQYNLFLENYPAFKELRVTSSLYQ